MCANLLVYRRSSATTRSFCSYATAFLWAKGKCAPCVSPGIPNTCYKSTRMTLKYVYSRIGQILFENVTCICDLYIYVLEGWIRSQALRSQLPTSSSSSHLSSSTSAPSTLRSAHASFGTILRCACVVRAVLAAERLTFEDYSGVIGLLVSGAVM